MLWFHNVMRKNEMMRRKKKPSVKERRIVRNYIEYMAGRVPRSEKAKILSDIKNAPAVLGREHMREVFRDALRKQGLTEDKLAENFVALTKAKKTHVTSFRGTIGDTKKFIDSSIRLEANKVLAKLMDLEPSKEVDMSHSGTVNSMSGLEILSDKELAALLVQCEEEEVLLNEENGNG